MPEFCAEKNDSGRRLDQFLAEKMPRLSRSRIQSLIKAGHALVNGAAAKASAKIRPHDKINIEEPPPQPIAAAPENIPLDVLFEDDDLIVINKPAGLVVHPAAGNANHTLVNALLNHCKSLSGIGGELRPGIVHRLDKETSGCIVAAKNDLAHHELAKQFAGRNVTKIYLALVAGRLQHRRGIIETAIGRHPTERKKMAVVARGRSSKTEFRVLQELGCGTLLACTLHTGRTHQIRVHLKHLGHSVLGDKLYAPKLAGDFSRQMLHAWKLGFAHPRIGAFVNFRAPVPEDFVKAGVRLSPDE